MDSCSAGHRHWSQAVILPIIPISSWLSHTRSNTFSQPHSGEDNSSFDFIKLSGNLLCSQRTMQAFCCSLMENKKIQLLLNTNTSKVILKVLQSISVECVWNHLRNDHGNIKGVFIQKFRRSLYYLQYILKISCKSCGNINKYYAFLNKFGNNLPCARQVSKRQFLKILQTQKTFLPFSSLSFLHTSNLFCIPVNTMYLPRLHVIVPFLSYHHSDVNIVLFSSIQDGLRHQRVRCSWPQLTTMPEACTRVPHTTATAAWVHLRQLM